MGPMLYTVLWKASAQKRAAELWLASTDRTRLTQAINAVDRRLRTDAHLAGESRSETERILFIRPIAVTFEVRMLDRIVNVTSVKLVPGQPEDEPEDQF